MVKSLTVSIESVEKGEHVSITGTQSATEFVPNVVITVGSYKVNLDSFLLAEALKAVVDFQSPPKTVVKMSTEPTPIGISNLGWTK